MPAQHHYGLGPEIDREHRAVRLTQLYGKGDQRGGGSKENGDFLSKKQQTNFFWFWQPKIPPPTPKNPAKTRNNLGWKQNDFGVEMEYFLAET